MLEFKDITLNDKSFLENKFKEYGFPVSDNCFGGLFIWQPAFKSQFAVYNDTLILRGSVDDKYFYQSPIGKNVSSAVELLIDTVGKELFFSGLCPTEKNFLQKNFDGKFEFTNNRDNSEYVYDRAALCTFAGKKYQQKRNHINKFVRLYGAPEVVALNGKNISLISDTEHLWLSEHNENDPRIIHENTALKRALEHFDELGLIGTAVRINGETVAFGIGEKLSEDTVIEHFEKASREMDGCYAVMIQEFARSLGDEVKYINREEDMGLEGLRKSKLSLKPAFMEEKYDSVFVG